MRKLLKAGLFPLQLVAAGQNIHERIVAGRVGFYGALFSVILVRQRDRRVGNCSAAAIRNDTSNRSVHILAPPGRRRERQNHYSR